MRRLNWKTVSTLVTMTLVAGCSETVSAPQATPSTGPASIRMAPQGRPSLSLSGTADNNTATDFVVGPNGGVFFIGNQAVVFPARSICDPNGSGYGPGTWDASCSALTRNITIHAVTRASGGRTQVDFTPSLRFVPSDNPARWVWLYMYTPSAVGAADLSAFNILYTPTLDSAPIDESVTDSSLRTYVDSYSGVSVRRVKHFSGYVSSGKCNQADSTAISNSCNDVPPPPPGGM